jgi:hypothetical protein
MWWWRGGSGDAGGAVDVAAWSRGGGGLGGGASRRWLRTLEIGLGLGQWGVVAAGESRTVSHRPHLLLLRSATEAH